MGRRRIGRRARRAWAVATVCAVFPASSCAALPDGGFEVAERTVPIDPRIVAWALADTCKRAHPSIDPIPTWASVPIVRTGPRSFVFEVARDGVHGPTRCATNGRLPRPMARVHTDFRLELIARDFEPGTGFTSTRGSDERIEIAVEPAAGSGSRVRIELTGGVAQRALRDRLLAILDVLSISHDALAALDAGDCDRAARSLESAAELLAGIEVSGLGEALAVLHSAGAAVELRRGDLLRARTALSSAATAAPRVAGLRARLAEIDERLARVGDARTTWAQLAGDRTIGALARVAAHHLREADELAVVAASPELAAARARAWIATGDETSAAAWSIVARAAAGGRCPSLEIDLARARGDHRIAFSLGLERLIRSGGEPRQVLALAEDADAYGDPGAGLRLLARHWRQLEPAFDVEVRALAARLADRTGCDLAARIGLSERCDPVVALALDATRAPTSGRPARARLGSLRAIAAALRSSASRPRDDFELAPGVAPLR